MSKFRGGSAVPRHFVFIMADGAFVVQLSENRAQDLLTGQFYTLDDNNYGHAITDYELNQLKVGGRVEHYNRTYVWLYMLPEPHQYNPKIKIQERVADRVRSYYINTMLPKSQLEIVRAMLRAVGLGDDVTPECRDERVVITGKDGVAFAHLKDAEEIQQRLAAKAQNLFKNSAVAFTEMTQTNHRFDQEVRPPDGAVTDLATIIASQTDTVMTRDKAVVLLVNQAEEQKAVRDLCAELKMNVRVAAGGYEGLQLLEDGHSDLVVMDLQLPDMHGWEMLSKAREISSLAEVPIIVLAEHSMSNQQSLALAVAKVDVYLVKPVSKAQLRQNIWMAMKKRLEKQSA